MTEGELIARLDARMESVDAHMKRADSLFEEIREELRLGREERRESREERRESREEHEDLRLFIRHQTALMQTAARGMQEAFAQSSARAELKLDKVIERLDDMGDQIRANTEATWRMLDRFSGNGGTAPATG